MIDTLLQRVAACCSVLQRVAACLHAAMCCSVFVVYIYWYVETCVCEIHCCSVW